MKFTEAYEIFEKLTPRQSRLVLAYFVGDDHEKFARIALSAMAEVGPDLWGDQ